jgi:hypothetical protein
MAVYCLAIFLLNIDLLKTDQKHIKMLKYVTSIYIPSEDGP